MAFNDQLWEVAGSTDTDDPNLLVDTRVRNGYPRLQAIGTTATDLAAAIKATAGIDAGLLPSYDANKAPVPPATSDRLADVKRALAYVPATGLSVFTGARFASYLGGSSETRVVDGAVLFNAVDQSFAPDPADAATTRPGLSYLRLGKPEAVVKDSDGKPLARRFDQMMDQKYGSGIGLFSDGGLNAWTRQPMNLRSNQAVNINGSQVVITSYGENTIVTYQIKDKDDIARINAGETVDVAVDRSIVNISSLRSTDLGWYKQTYDRGRALTYSTANKGDYGIGAAYALSVGAAFTHSIAANLATEFAGKVEVSKGFGVEVGATGATFKHPFGSWSLENTAELSAGRKVTLSISGVDALPIKVAMATYSAVLHAAVAAQSLAFTSYNAVLAGSADRTLKDGDSDDQHGMLTVFDKGVLIYELAISLSAASCAAGCVMAAIQAVWASARKPLPGMPIIELTPTGMELTCGLSGISISNLGVTINGPIVTINSNQINNNAATINNNLGTNVVLIGGLFD